MGRQREVASSMLSGWEMESSSAAAREGAVFVSAGRRRERAAVGFSMKEGAAVSWLEEGEKQSVSACVREERFDCSCERRGECYVAEMEMGRKAAAVGYIKPKTVFRPWMGEVRAFGLGKESKSFRLRRGGDISCHVHLKREPREGWSKELCRRLGRGGNFSCCPLPCAGIQRGRRGNRSAVGAV